MNEQDLNERLRQSQELTARLQREHPLLFLKPSPFGQYAVSIHPGWYSIVDELCSKIESTLLPEQIGEMSVTQIKEKFGTLVFTVGTENQGTRRVVGELAAEAAEKSSRTCVRCGRPARISNHGGYIAPLCETHANPPS